jgi:hypothetical protein
MKIRLLASRFCKECSLRHASASFRHQNICVFSMNRMKYQTSALRFCTECSLRHAVCIIQTSEYICIFNNQNKYQTSVFLILHKNFSLPRSLHHSDIRMHMFLIIKNDNQTIGFAVLSMSFCLSCSVHHSGSSKRYQGMCFK